MSAFAVAIMLAAYFPYVSISAPAIAGLAIMLVFIETGFSYAMGSFLISAVLSFIFCEKEAATLFALVFGIYPILKSFFEKIKNRVLEYVVKLLYLNISAAGAYFITVFVFGIPFDETGIKWIVYAFVAFYNVFFVLYDICLSKITLFYLNKYHQRFVRLFGRLK